ncbi:mevalonate kinase-like isoform X3 [Sinocyclocheilus anshuiensis]|uniref:Mevalonate kinase n=1 Tax=Sinocyclocheilus anshuiensis TaxID=1608454 RepID=A0A671Q1V1_9TELE|nr:PREDICTED: mevalonate kinase-like isoform X3 [Sinocyclocheilus anshuiensis]
MQTREFFVSGPGKVILHGEHSVVHGKVALAVSLNLRTFLRLQSTSSGEVHINLPNIDTFLSWEITALQPLLAGCKAEQGGLKELDADLLKRLREFTGISEDSTDTRSMAVLAFLYMYLSVFAESLASITVSVWSELPTGAGLGSSAAYNVCLSAALLSARGNISYPLTPQQESASKEEMELINRWAFMGEKIIHGNPSGVDNAVGTWGGFLRYHAGNITPLSWVPILRILLTNTKVPRSPKVLVSAVKDKINKFPSVMKPVLESVSAVSCACEQTLTEMAAHGPSAELYNILEELIDINQHHLNVMGVGHSSLDTLCRVTLARGLHSKLTGAGGGGCGITLLRPETDTSVIQRTVEELKACGFDCWETSIGAPGVQQHSSAALSQDILKILHSY